MMSVYNCKTKQILKGRIGQSADGLFRETSLYGPEYKGDGRYAIVGPSPTERKWYAEVTVVNGTITKVS